MSPDTPRRVAGFDYRGPRRYFITTCTYRRSRCLIDPAGNCRIAEQLSPHFEVHGFAVLAYCLMPDHVHLLLEGVVGPADLGEAMRSWKQRTGYEWKRRCGVPLWQEGFHDRVLREEDDTPAVIRYVLENPVRAGLVAAAADYPWIGSSRYTVAELLESAATWKPAWKRGR
jgi:REP element-mobilizing transposase RayT